KAEPYELNWWDAPDMGREIDALAVSTPFDWVEEHRWDPNVPGGVAHEFRIGYPRLGRRRQDLAFVLGENVIDLDEPERDGEYYANAVIGIGAGEGKGSVRRETGTRDGRLYRPYVYMAKDVTNATRM